MFPVGVIPGTRFPVTPRIVTPFFMFPAWMFESIVFVTGKTTILLYPIYPVDNWESEEISLTT
jgi:hypothetical protein